MVYFRPIVASFAAFALAAMMFGSVSANAGSISALQLQIVPDDSLIQETQYYGLRRDYDHRRSYGRPTYRPRCYFVDRRVWNGYRWVIRPTRVCR